MALIKIRFMHSYPLVEKKVNPSHAALQQSSQSWREGRQLGEGGVESLCYFARPCRKTGCRLAMPEDKQLFLGKSGQGCRPSPLWDKARYDAMQDIQRIFHARGHIFLTF
jgi:hypothetical protein